MTDLKFRVAGLDDANAIVALVTSAYRGESSRAGWTTEADLLEGARIDPDILRDDIQREGSTILLAEHTTGGPGAGAAELVACAHVAREGDAGYFGMFSVAPTLQGGGIGSRVLAECERIAREEWGLTRMRMTVIDVRDELLAYYQRRGYLRTGIHKPFPYGDARFGLPLRDDLRFEVLEKPLARETP